MTEKVITKKFQIYEKSKSDNEFYDKTNGDVKNAQEKLSVPCKRCNVFFITRSSLK